MKVNMTIAYKEQYLPTPRCRKLRERTVEEDVEVTVQETAKAEAPVVFVVHDYERYWGYTDVEVRRFKGILYKRPYNFDYVCISDAAEADFATPDDMQRCLKRRCTCYPHPNSKAEAVRGADAETKRYLIIDGELWERCGEPMYVYHTFGLGHNHGGTSLSIAWFYNDNIGNDRYFNALQKAEAEAAAVRTAEARGDTDYIDFIKNSDINITVLDESAVTRCPKKEHGTGCELLNAFEAMAEASDSSFEAGLCAIALAMKE